MLTSEKYFILPILWRYWLRNIAVAIHISKNEDRERASNTMDNDSADDGAGLFVTYETMGYGLTSGNAAELEKQDARYVSETTRLTEASAKDMVQSIIA